MGTRLRYKILDINGQNYVIDADKPFWVLFFPVFYWIIPHTVYKINDVEILQQVKTPKYVYLQGCFYLFFMTFVVLGYLMFVEFGNVIILFFSMF